MDKEKDHSKVFRYLREMDINPNEAINILKKAVEFNPRNRGSVWKMRRFQLYLWQRLKEEKEGYLPTKAETVRRLVYSKEYKKEYMEFFSYKFTRGHPDYELYSKDKESWIKLEVYRLNLLVTDPRQSHFFKSKYFYYPNSKIKIPQVVINRINPYRKDKKD